VSDSAGTSQRGSLEKARRLPAPEDHLSPGAGRNITAGLDSALTLSGTMSGFRDGWVSS
jgi:hypothetical protein